ncbi:beta family protein [Rhodoferax mekongensis]|uniref:Uncharacterized protein n=1 Tax=Rhodoferax mekongensis TaxID=3068341 RepID=A0ABZ0AWB7_9BURK|nr:hypothetical protein [Rhodoferax sp. TBRC 17307]WNO03928.1 hypothetical protein RAN89_13535 [Rhodoferax sp. TBRC 17307]
MKNAKYFPILPLGRASGVGISSAIEASPQAITPIFVAASPSVDPITLEFQYSPMRHALNILECLTQFTSDSSAFGLQLPNPPDDASLGETSLMGVYESLLSGGRQVYPVLAITGPDIWKVQAQALRKVNRLNKWIFRLTLTNRGATAEELRSWVSRALDVVVAEPEDVDLVVDLGYVGGWQTMSSVGGVEHWLRVLSESFNWRNVGLIASSLPSFFRNNTSDSFPVIRDDWALFRELRRRMGSGVQLSFGDYSIFGSPSSLCPPSAGSEMLFPYSGASSWFVFKADPGAASLSEECHRLMQRLAGYPAIYMGADFSFGDAHLARLAEGGFAKDDLGYYVGVISALVSHHSDLVASQLRRLSV